MKLYRLTAVLSFLYLLGVAGNNDASLACMGTKLLMCLLSAAGKEAF